MKVKFREPWHVKDKEFLAKRKAFLLREITRWNRLERPGFYILKAKPAGIRYGIIWWDFTYAKPPHTHTVNLAIYENRGYKITEQSFEIVK